MGRDAEQVDQPVILDNTVLTNFALIGRADLVTHLWPTTACTTPPVLDEYRSGVVSGLVPADLWADLTVITLTEEETALADSFSTRLGSGERSCPAAAVRRQGLLATDDLDARRIAQQQNVPLTGTIGILILCVRRGYLSREEADGLLAAPQGDGPLPRRNRAILTLMGVHGLLYAINQVTSLSLLD